MDCVKYPGSIVGEPLLLSYRDDMESNTEKIILKI